MSGEAEGGSLLFGEAQGRERRFSGVWGRSGTREKVLLCLEKLEKALLCLGKPRGEREGSLLSGEAGEGYNMQHLAQPL